MRRWTLLLLLLALGPGLAEAQPGTTYQPANPWMFVTGTTIRTVPGITQVRTPELVPLTDDGAALGSTTRSWADLFLASGGIINWNNGDVTLTHSANAITLAGGQLLLPDGSPSGPSLTFSDNTNLGLFSPSADDLGVTVAGTERVRFAGDGNFVLRSATQLQWASGNIGTTVDLILLRDAAAVLAQRNGTNAQESRIENTFTDANNREFASLGFINASNVFVIQTEALGTGTRRGMLLDSELTVGSSALTVNVGGLGFTTVTAAASAPGAGGGKLEWRCGTNAGTIKIVAYGGTSSTGVTVTDNIGAGVTSC